MADHVIEGKAGFEAEDLAERPGLIARLDSVAVPVGARWPAAALAAVGLAIFFVHLPVLMHHYFVGDDFVPLADIASRSTPDYLRDLFLLRDVTPNWRFLTGLAYLGLYRAFGLDAMPFFLVSVLVHIGTAGLIFWLVRRVTSAAWPGLLAASFFGLTSAHAHTIGLVTAFNNVLAAFLLMLSLVTLYEGLERRQLGPWLAVSVASFAGAVAANESAAVLTPVPVLFMLWKAPTEADWWRQPQQWPRLALLSAPYVAIGAATLIAFAACDCTEATHGGVADWGDHVIGNFWIYLGRLLYPVGMEYPGKVEAAHLAAGITLALLMLAALARGPALARICAAFIVLALLPYLPIRFALAPRYVYMASIPFSMLAAFAFIEAAELGRRLTPIAPAALAAVALGVLALYSWQTWEQNNVIERASDDWRALVTGLDERVPDPPDGSRVYVRGGPITGALPQFVVLPAVGELLWGKVELFSVPEGTSSFCIRPGDPLYVVDFDGGRFTPVGVIEPQDAPTAPYEWPPPVPPACPERVPAP